jgi:hypothetical protein
MPRKRNHYVPQFLLRRFASRGNRKRHWVWQFRSGAGPIEVMTKNAAVSTYFYGQPETGVEDAFANLEGKQAALLCDLEAGQDPNERAQELRVFVWSMSFRTRALRIQFADTAVRAIEQMMAADGKTITEAFGREIANNFDHHLDEVLAKLPPAQRALIRKMLAQPGASEAAREHVLGEIEAAVPMVEAMLEQASGGMQDAAESGHVKGLMKAFAEGKQVPDRFEVSHWSIERFDANSVVLGDGVVFAAGPDGDLGALGKFTKDFAAVYAPIGHDRVLVGKREEGTPTLGIDEVNVASVQHSLDTFFASRRTDVEVKLAEEIATGEPILSDEELRRIAGDSWKSLGEPRSGDPSD